MNKNISKILFKNVVQFLMNNSSVFRTINQQLKFFSN